MIEAPDAEPEIAYPTMQSTPVEMRTNGGFGAFLGKVWAVAEKDLRAELRAKEVFATMASFSVLGVIVFGLAFDLRVPKPEMVAPGVLWVVVLYSGLLGLNRSFGAEADRGTLAGLLIAPVDRSAIYFGKMIANLAFMLATQVVTLPVMLVIFNLNLMQPLILLGLFLGIVGYVAVGTLFAALTSSTRARESMLPILLLPVMVPVFVAGLGLTGAILDGHNLTGVNRWLAMLGGYDLAFITIAYLVIDLIWEDV